MNRLRKPCFVVLLLVLLAIPSRADEIDASEKKICESFRVQLRSLARQSRGLAQRIDRFWHGSSIMIVAIDRSGTQCYSGGIEATNIVDYQPVLESLEMVLDGLDLLPANLRKVLAGSGIYLPVERLERESRVNLILSPYRYNRARNNQVYRNMRYGILLNSPFTQEDLMRGLGWMVDTQVCGTYWNSRKNRFLRLRDGFKTHREAFVSEMHSVDETLGFFSDEAKSDSYWDVGVHFMAYALERERFCHLAEEDPSLSFKFRYMEALFAFDPDVRREPRLPDLPKSEEGVVARPLTQEEIEARWLEALETHRKKNEELARRLETLYREKDILILPVRRNSNDLYRSGLRLGDVIDFEMVEPGLETVFRSFSRLTEPVLGLLKGTGVYVSSRQGRSYAILSPFQRNRGPNPDQAWPLRNLRRGFIFEKNGGEYSEETATHELGHVVDGRIRALYGAEAFCAEMRNLFRPRRNDWKERFSGFESGDFVSSYAASNVQEDVAESFRMYAHHQEQFRTLAEKNPRLLSKYHFMRDLFSGG